MTTLLVNTRVHFDAWFSSAHSPHFLESRLETPKHWELLGRVERTLGEILSCQKHGRKEESLLARHGLAVLGDAKGSPFLERQARDLGSLITVTQPWSKLWGLPFFQPSVVSSNPFYWVFICCLCISLNLRSPVWRVRMRPWPFSP